MHVTGLRQEGFIPLWKRDEKVISPQHASFDAIILEPFNPHWVS
jgi:hypothetical protein